jgi:hypothetical protein
MSHIWIGPNERSARLDGARLCAWRLRWIVMSHSWAELLDPSSRVITPRAPLSTGRPAAPHTCLAVVVKLAR